MPLAGLDQARLDALPGVESSAAVLLRPLWGRVGMDWPLMVEGQSEKEAELNPPLNAQIVTHDFFRTMEIQRLVGRSFRSIVDLPALGLKDATVTGLGEMGESVAATTERLADGRLKITASDAVRAYRIQ